MAFATYEDAAKNFRRFVGDLPQLNELDQRIESSDEEMIDYIKDTLNDINIAYEPKTHWQLKDILVEPGENCRVPWNVVKTGALLQLLTAKGVLDARNYLTYSDAGGVTVTNHDRWGRYINYFNVLVNKYVNGVRTIKIRENVELCYGGLGSPLGFDYY